VDAAASTEVCRRAGQRVLLQGEVHQGDHEAKLHRQAGQDKGINIRGNSGIYGK
jgi:hypothetical protein